MGYRFIVLFSVLLAGPVLADTPKVPLSELTLSLFNDVAMPAQRALANNTAQLGQRMTELCASPDQTTLQAAQVAWKDTSNTWNRIAPLHLGPNRQTAVQSLFEGGPVDEAILKKAILTTPDDPATPKAIFETAGIALGASGLPALEQLLFGDGKVSPLPALQRGKTCQFGRWIALGLARRGQTLIYEWNSLHDGLTQNPAYHTPYLTEAISHAASGARVIADHQLAAGELDPPPADFPGWRSDTSKAGIAASIDGIEYVLFGSPSGIGFDDLLASRGQSAVVDALHDQLVNIRLALTALPESFARNPGASRGEIVALQRRLNELADYINGPLTDALGVPFKH